VVDVVDEEVQRAGPLGQTALYGRPLGGGDHPRHEVERENLLGACVVAVHAEGDAQCEHRALRGALPAREIRLGQPRERAQKQTAARAGTAFDVEHLVEKPPGS